jgi:hypothetical protein
MIKAQAAWLLACFVFFVKFSFLHAIDYFLSMANIKELFEKEHHSASILNLARVFDGGGVFSTSVEVSGPTTVS